MVGARGWRRRRGTWCLIGTECQFEKMRKFWSWMVGWLHNIANVPNTTELGT